MKQVFALIAPTIVGMAAYQINIFISTYLATDSGTGSVAGLQYSLRLQELVLGVFVISLGTVLLPDLAGAARSEDWDSYSGSLRRGLRAMLLITIPIAVYSMIVGEDIVTLLFRHREFGPESVRLTSSIFFWHMSGLAFIAMNRVMAPAFYARGDTKTPTWAGLVSVAINMSPRLRPRRSSQGARHRPGLSPGRARPTLSSSSSPPSRSEYPGAKKALGRAGDIRSSLSYFRPSRPCRSSSLGPSLAALLGLEP